MAEKYILPYIVIKKINGVKSYNYLFDRKIPPREDHPVRRTLFNDLSDINSHEYSNNQAFNLPNTSIDGIIIVGAYENAFPIINSAINKKHPDVELLEVKSYEEAKKEFERNALSRIKIKPNQNGIVK